MIFSRWHFLGIWSSLLKTYLTVIDRRNGPLVLGAMAYRRGDGMLTGIHDSRSSGEKYGPRYPERRSHKSMVEVVECHICKPIDSVGGWLCLILISSKTCISTRLPLYICMGHVCHYILTTAESTSLWKDRPRGIATSCGGHYIYESNPRSQRLS